MLLSKATLVLVLLSVTGSAWAVDEDLPNFFSVPKQSSPTASIDPNAPVNLYRGGRPTEAGLETLKSLGVVTIIDLQGGDLNVTSDIPGLGGIVRKKIKNSEPGELPENIEIERAQAAKLGINFYHYPLNSLNDMTDEEAASVDTILNIIEDAQTSDRPVYVHCQHGKDRTGMIIALERVLYEGWSPKDAKKEWVSKGHGFLAQIATHSLDEFFNDRVKSPAPADDPEDEDHNGKR